MSENPYQTPASSRSEFDRPVEAAFNLVELRLIAESQRRVLLCFLGQLILYVLSSKIPWEYVEVLWVAVLILSLGCVVQLVNRLKGWVAAAVVGFFSMIPLVGMVVLLTVGASAAWVLRRAGFKIGLLGVNPHQIQEAIDARENRRVPES